ncbi:hypothetical protein ACSRUE_06825 [Sorangium sp. KYC3313]|uniref:hypothetical protein n=1 Tax=Sorangium sp. KYC3313 TaxID=3449740 RepID=UPI003F8CAF68
MKKTTQRDRRQAKTKAQTIVKTARSDDALPNQQAVAVQSCQTSIVQEEMEKARKGGYVYRSAVAQGLARFPIGETGNVLILATEHAAVGLQSQAVVNLKKAMPEEVAVARFGDSFDKGLLAVMEDKNFDFTELDRVGGTRLLDQCEAWAYKIHTLFQRHREVVIHCNHGRTRTPIVAIAYLWLYSNAGETIKALAKSVRDKIMTERPNCGQVLGDGSKMVNVLEHGALTRERWKTRQGKK